MNMLPVRTQNKSSLEKKLYGYMIILGGIIFAAIVIGLYIIGSFNSIHDDYYDSLSMQMEVFANDIESGFDALAYKGIKLSETTREVINEYGKGVGFNGGTFSNDGYIALQSKLIEPLHQYLLQADCSGVFIVLNTSVYGNDSDSKMGIYLQKSNFTAGGSTDTILLYRGDSRVGKQHGIMPHRKWGLEFQKDAFPDFDIMFSGDLTSMYNIYSITDSFELTGTFEKAMLLTVPIVGKDNVVYGVCGFEISSSFFKYKYSQPSVFPNLTFIFAPDRHSHIDTTKGASSGVLDGYYLKPEDKLVWTGYGKKLMEFQGETTESIGLLKEISLHDKETSYILSVLIPKNDYVNDIIESFIKIGIFIFLLTIVTISSCVYLSKKFIRPILYALDSLKSEEVHEIDSDVQEINDLFTFLSAKNKRQDERLQGLEQEKANALEAYKKAQMEIDRLAYSRKQEIDPDNYKHFLESVKTLTPTEKTIFEYYLSGKNGKEIMEIAGIKESTLRYHNQNIYRKLGVNSLKQLLRYAALMKQSEK